MSTFVHYDRKQYPSTERLSFAPRANAMVSITDDKTALETRSRSTEVEGTSVRTVTGVKTIPPLHVRGSQSRQKVLQIKKICDDAGLARLKEKNKKGSVVQRNGRCALATHVGATMASVDTSVKDLDSDVVPHIDIKAEELIVTSSHESA